jgi:hypothetical protein
MRKFKFDIRFIPEGSKCTIAVKDEVIAEEDYKARAIMEARYGKGNIQNLFLIDKEWVD